MIYRSKLGNQRFDVIVAAFSEPFQFVLGARDELWPGVPVVVCGVDERSVHDLKPPPGFAVLTIRFNIEGTVRAAQTLLPDTRHIALIGGRRRQSDCWRPRSLTSRNYDRASPAELGLRRRAVLRAPF